MSTQLLSRDGRDAFSPRLLGTIGLLTSPMLLLEGIVFVLDEAGNRNSPIVGVMGIIYLFGWACILLGMRRLGVMGDSSASKVVFVIQLGLLFTALLFSLQELIYGSWEKIPFPILDLGWPLGHTFMLIMGAFVIGAGVWQGWRRYLPFLFGLKLPLFFACQGLGHDVAGVISVAFSAGVFALMGVAVRKLSL